MATIDYIPALDFDDVALVPQRSSIESRDDIDTSTRLNRNVTLKIPIISAPMRSITGGKMAKAIAEEGGMGLIHRFCSITEQEEMYKEATGLEGILEGKVGCAIGINGSENERFERLHKLGCRVFAVDVAHADHERVFKIIKGLAEDCFVMAGAVCTFEGARSLFEAGVDAVAVGVGSGQVCLTREVTGNGVPQLSAIQDASKSGSIIVSEGGIRKSGDIVKALCFAHAVTIGYLFAGTLESETRLTYYGNSLFVGGGERSHRYIEGRISSDLPNFERPVKDVVRELMEGVRSGMSYQGARNLAELRAKAKLRVLSR